MIWKMGNVLLFIMSKYDFSFGKRCKIRDLIQLPLLFVTWICNKQGILKLYLNSFQTILVILVKTAEKEAISIVVVHAP